jgi:hypothetical protein
VRAIIFAAMVLSMSERFFRGQKLNEKVKRKHLRKKYHEKDECKMMNEKR